MQDAEAVNEVKALLEPIERERVHPPVLNGRAEQAMDGAEPLPTLQLNAPPGGDPEPILLVVHRHDPLGPPPLQKRVASKQPTSSTLIPAKSSDRVETR
jgi:hypothetical protein